MEKFMESLRQSGLKEASGPSGPKTRRRESGVGLGEVSEYRMRRVDYVEPELNGEGFVRMSSDARLTQLRSRLARPNRQELRQQKGERQATKTAFKTSQGPRFKSVALLISDWKEVDPSKFGAEELRVAEEVTIETCRSEDSADRVAEKLSAARTGRSCAVPRVAAEQVVCSPLADPDMKKLYAETQPAPGEKAVFMTEQVFEVFASAVKREFPYNINFTREGDKFVFFHEHNATNPFVSFVTYNENSRKLPEAQEEICLLSEEATIAESSLKRLADPSTRRQTHRIVKVQIADTLTLYVRLRVDASDETGQTLLVKAFYDDGSNWKSDFAQRFEEFSVEAQNSNLGRMLAWAACARFLEARHVLLGFLASSGENDFALMKLVKKPVTAILQLFNMNEDDVLKFFLEAISPLLALPDGTYVLHKAESKTVKSEWKANLSVYCIPPKKD